LRLRDDTLLPVLDFLSGTPSGSFLSNSSANREYIRLQPKGKMEIPVNNENPG
jgi:hypothetical protein